MGGEGGDVCPVDVGAIAKTSCLSDASISKEWQSRHRGPAAILGALDEVAALAQEQGTLRLMCHCAPKRCHSLRIRTEIWARCERLGQGQKITLQKPESDWLSNAYRE